MRRRKNNTNHAGGLSLEKVKERMKSQITSCKNMEYGKKIKPNTNNRIGRMDVFLKKQATIPEKNSIEII